MAKRLLVIGVVLAALAGGLYFFLAKQPAPTQPTVTETVLEEQAESDLKSTEIRDEADPNSEAEARVEPESQAEVKSSSYRAAKGHFEVSASYPGQALSESDLILSGKAKEKRLRAVFEQKDSDLFKEAKLEKLSCRETICTVVAAAKGTSMERFQLPIYSLLDDQPWVGNKIDVTTLDAEGLRAKFVFLYEMPK